MVAPKLGCAAMTAKESSQNLTANDIFALAKAKFVYTPDKIVWGKDEYWATIREMEEAAGRHSGDVLDDCDGFATLCVASLRKIGSRARYVFCQTESGEYHCVAECEGEILDNRQSSVLPIHLIPYKWISISGYNAGDPWHEIKQ
jgi:predicted transglutaminase-like cysteine proteinase